MLNWCVWYLHSREHGLHCTPPVLSFHFVGMETIVDPCVARWHILLEGQEMRRDDAVVECKLFHVVSPIVDAFSGVHCIHNLDNVLVQQEPIEGYICTDLQVSRTQHLPEKMVIVSQCVSHFARGIRTNHFTID